MEGKGIGLLRKMFAERGVLNREKRMNPFKQNQTNIQQQTVENQTAFTMLDVMSRIVPAISGSEAIISSIFRMEVRTVE